MNAGFKGNFKAGSIPISSIGSFLGATSNEKLVVEPWFRSIATDVRLQNENKIRTPMLMAPKGVTWGKLGHLRQRRSV